MSAPAHGIGHNNGPAMDAGRTWRVHAWRRAKANMASARINPTTVRRHLARARELGLSYRDYAAIQTTAGRDVCGFLFSSNALDLAFGRHRVPEARAGKLDAVRDAARIALVHAPIPPHAVEAANPVLDAAHPAPPLLTRFSRMKSALAHAQGRLPASGLVVVGMGLEEEWVAAGRLGAFLPAEAYFDT
ncbi:hypothetical protein OB2597_01045 [Pseudooceanicola batsensis HTCC2597]|uniref:Uncharacterized protein n=1 Tax=Pseudooceanicola batsensis (strain ATCC BAA-863 / DSM 15984 / KCTC 12145 / HTCC2597) TaxID=252305 RepID=A3U226_PSEBH|nr:hypothetical protein [Pseudooceanicola batsensis]EAQ01960.1 hypothetical protein OB2597_01045 [Pseudooceanicola batsensis HTCC2597]